MKNQKGISLITLIILITIIAGVIIFIIANNQGNTRTFIEWEIPFPSAYYELRLAATKSEVYRDVEGVLSSTSFESLGKDIKKSKGKWFKNNNSNFKAVVLDTENTEQTILTNGEYVAIFQFFIEKDYVFYVFCHKDNLEAYGYPNYNKFDFYTIKIE